MGWVSERPFGLKRKKKWDVHIHPDGWRQERTAVGFSVGSCLQQVCSVGKDSVVVGAC
jgi:hypothetical protein